LKNLKNMQNLHQSIDYLQVETIFLFKYFLYVWNQICLFGYSRHPITRNHILDIQYILPKNFLALKRDKVQCFISIINLT
jgi:hypothetical protein